MTGLEVLKWRNAQGLSRMQLAHRLNISYFTIARWERENTTPSNMAQEKLVALMLEGKEESK